MVPRYLLKELAPLWEVAAGGSPKPDARSLLALLSIFEYEPDLFSRKRAILLRVSSLLRWVHQDAHFGNLLVSAASYE